MAFFVGHEAGHLLAGHQPVLLAAAAGADGYKEGEKDPEFFVDEFIAEAASKNESASVHSLRLNARMFKAPERAKAIRVPQEMLVDWSAVVSTP